MKHTLCHARIVAALDDLAAEIPILWQDNQTFYPHFEHKAEEILRRARLEEEDYVYARLRDMLAHFDIPARPDFR